MSKPLIDVRGSRFVDHLGRQAILRGVNLGGDCKVPWPDGGTDRPSDFSDHRTVSFVGRPFPLDEADEHLGRIARWGFNTLRLLTTWEAVEHAGPGQYDQDYLDYFVAVVEKARAHGLVVFVDFHQDVWSRMSGGDGAPGWVFEALGLDFTRFDAADAAHVMQHRYDYDSPEARQEDRYPMMSWASNYRLAVNGVAWTAFFAGATLTPDWMVEGRNVQHFLQDHYLGAMAALAARVAHLDNVIGFDTFNEPGLGWVGLPMSQPRLRVTPEDPMHVWPGACWTPFDGLRAARGQTVSITRLGWSDEKGVLRPVGEAPANVAGVSIWTQDGPDPFERAGAWRLNAGHDAEVLDEDFFRVHDGRPIDHENQFMAPFFARVAQTIRAVRGDWLVFAELCPYVLGTGRMFPEAMPERSVNASHWYDINILRKKRFDPGQDLETLSALYFNQLAYVGWLGTRFGDEGAPTLIGEFGIPYDLNGGDAFEAWDRGERGPAPWAAHSRALGLMYDALDALKLSSTQWNYTASNRNDLRVGDGWNQEDLSIYSADQVDEGANDPDAGARALLGFCRPYARLTQGVIGSMRFADGRFELELEADPKIDAPTEIFAPAVVFPRGVQVRLSQPGARWEHDREAQLVRVWAGEAGTLAVVVEAA